MSQINIENLLKVGQPTQLGKVSPLAPQYKSSSFQGGQVQVGQAAQNIGPSSEESMYGALAEIAGSITKGIDIFSNIQSTQEKETIAKAKNKFKEIYSSDYAKSSEPGSLNTGKYATPEEKLNAWNAYIKDVWTPLAGNEWITDLNMDAYSAFGNEEAQDKFEEQRYNREFTDYFNRPENKYVMNSNAPGARIAFDSQYSSKYGSASGNRWFMQESQKNWTSSQTEIDNIALQGLQESLGTILQVPPTETANIIAAGGTDAAAQLRQEVFRPFYSEILPAIRTARNEKEVAAVLHRFYTKHLIEENPKGYQQHTLDVLSKELPKIAASQAPQILQLRSTIEVATRSMESKDRLGRRLISLQDPNSYSKSINPFWRGALTDLPYLGVTKADQPNFVLGLIGQIWSSGYNASEQVLRVPLQVSVDKNNDNYKLLAKAFPSLEKITTAEGSNLSGLSVEEQFEAVTGMVLLNTFIEDPQGLGRLKTLFQATSVEDLIPKIKSAVSGFVITNPAMKEASDKYNQKQKESLDLLHQFVLGSSNPTKIEEATSIRIDSLAAGVKLDSKLFKSIYSRTDERGIVYPNPNFNIDTWYTGLTPEDKAKVDASGVMYGVNRNRLQTAVKDAFDITLRGTEAINKLKEAASKQLEAVTKEQDKQFEASLKDAQDIIKQGKVWAFDRTNTTAENTKGDLSVGILTGSMVKDETNNKFHPLLMSVIQANEVYESIPKKDGVIDITQATPNQRLLLAPLVKLQEWRDSGNTEMIQAAEMVDSSIASFNEMMAEAEAYKGSFIEIQKGIIPENQFDPEIASKDFDVRLRGFKRRLLTNQLPAYNGTYSSSEAEKPDGKLGINDYAFTWLLQTDLTTRRLMTSNAPVLTDKSGRTQLGEIIDNLTDNIGANVNPKSFTETPANVMPYLGFLLIGKNVQYGLDHGFTNNNFGRAGWFVDRVAQMAHMSASANLEDAGRYFSSAEFRLHANFVADFPYTLSYFMRATRGSENALMITNPGTADQLAIPKPTPNTTVLYGTNAITQPSFENLGILDQTQRDQYIKDALQRDPESLQALLAPAMTGKVIGPDDPAWSPQLALVLWRKAGIIPNEMTDQMFASTIASQLLSGSAMDFSTDDQRIRAAFSVIDTMERTQDKLFSNLLTMAMDRQRGIGSDAFPLPPGRTQVDDLLQFVTAGAGIYAGYQTSTITQDDKQSPIRYNDSFANQTMVQLSSDGRMGTMYSVKTDTKDRSYTVNAIVDGATKASSRESTAYITSEELQQRDSRFKPAKNMSKNTQEDGPLFIAGRRLLSAEPKKEIIKTLLYPYLRNVENTPVFYALLGTDTFEQLEQEPTVFDALVKLDSKLENLQKENPSLSIPRLIKKELLYKKTEDGKGYSPELKEGSGTVSQNIALTDRNRMAFTFPWINTGNNNIPLLHIPDSVWEYSLIGKEEKKIKQMVDFNLPKENK